MTAPSHNSHPRGADVVYFGNGPSPDPVSSVQLRPAGEGFAAPGHIRTCTVCDDSDGRHHAVHKRLTSIWPLLDMAAWQEVYAAHCEFLARLHAIVERSCYRDGLRKAAGRKPRGRPRKGAGE